MDPKKLFAALTALIVFTGCENIRLANGMYETTLSGRRDSAAVYDDMIILRLRNPQKESGTEDGYWDWGGKYEVIDGDRIMLKMNRETARVWGFYYDLLMRRNGIEVVDHRAGSSYRLEYIPAVPNRRRDTTTPAAYPAYR